MGVDVFVSYLPDWTEYDRLWEERKTCEDAERQKKIDEEIERIEDKAYGYPLPDAWRKKDGLDDGFDIGFISGSRSEIASFEDVKLLVDGHRFPCLWDILTYGGNAFVKNDWEWTFRYGSKCLAVLNGFLADCKQDPFDEERQWQIERMYSARRILSRLVPLAECIMISGEMENYRAMHNS